uniref:ARAD1C02816p n=1 Tax=Blastobotrys adeninivorans TaxID=409370 RepID=A0A060T536_BLAAD
MSEPVPPIRVILSNVAGSTSLACWIVLLLPQLIEQWRTKSADGISIGFLLTWAAGDVANLIGAIWAGLLPEVILLAVWYCFSDSLLIASYFYYKHRDALINKHKHDHEEGIHHHHHHHHHHQQQHSQDEDPTQPLLNRRNSAQRRSSLAEVADESANSVFVRIVFPVLFVIVAGVVGFFFSDGEDQTIDDPSKETKLGPQILGYISAALYLGARIPQIIQNHRRRSVYGLSLLFFIFSTLGNVTYAAQIFIYRFDAKWLVLNLSWILGSLGTVFEDIIIFAQFYIYKNSKETAIEQS